MQFLQNLTDVSVSALFFITNSYAANMKLEQQKINAKIGSQFSIELKSNPTTGYLWILRKLPENVAYIDSQYEENISCKKNLLDVAVVQQCILLPFPPECLRSSCNMLNLANHFLKKVRLTILI